MSIVFKEKEVIVILAIYKFLLPNYVYNQSVAFTETDRGTMKKED